MPQPQPNLKHHLPEGQVVNRAWLLAKGFSRPRIDAFMRNGSLEAVARGAYRRPGPPLKWQHLAYSLQALGLDLHIGGLTALQQHGLSHYLAMSQNETIHLYGRDTPPRWLKKVEGNFSFIGHKLKLYDPLPAEALTSQPFGHWDWPILYATPELALLELAADVRANADFSQLDSVFEAALNLRPALLQSLLATCTQVKAKRLFLWFAERHQHAWFRALDVDALDLGSGKRVIASGGALDPRFQITVPKEMASQDGDFF